MFPTSLCLEFDFHSGLDSMLQRSGGSQARYFTFDIERGFPNIMVPSWLHSPTCARFFTFVPMWKNSQCFFFTRNRYGDIVRLGLNILSFGKPEAVKDT